MFATISKWFKRPVPAVGDKWVLKKGKDPWGAKTHTATILDVRDGWVRYSMGGLFTDERLEISIFVAIYRPV